MSIIDINKIYRQRRGATCWVCESMAGEIPPANFFKSKILKIK